MACSLIPPDFSEIVTALPDPPTAASPDDWAASVERSLRALVPGAFFVLPRVLRRVLRHELEISSPWVRIPHRKAFVISRDRLVWLVAMDELDAPEGTELPPWVILIARPEDEQLAQLSMTDLRRIYWRLLFHAQVDAALLDRLAPDRLTIAQLRRRIDRLGQEQFDEIRAVLRQEAMLLHPDDLRRTYAEFIAVYWELRFFAPDLLPLYFPSLGPLDKIDPILRDELDPHPLLEATRPPELAGEDPATAPRRTTETAPMREALVAARQTPSPGKYRRWMRAADQARAKGNQARAALDRQRAVLVAPPDVAEEAFAARRAEVALFAQRLQQALELPDEEMQRWQDALLDLLTGAVEGFWNANLRLLYDLQKVCVDHEREIYRVDLWKWLLSRGQRPLQRPLPQLRTVLMAKHLTAASRRIGRVRMDRDARGRLTELLYHAAEQAEELLRRRMEPQVVQACAAVGLEPETVVEQVAFRKLSAELLDGVVARGFLTLGHVRDAVSRSPLKLADLAGWREFLHGDLLLRIDQELSKTLDGVYQRGPFYLRWLQRMTSLAFGTTWGRVFVQYLALPFGGAAMILAGPHFLLLELHHLLHTPEFTIYTHARMLGLGAILFVLMHGPQFREAAWMLWVWLVRGLKLVTIELPRALGLVPILGWLWRSLPVVVVRRYLVSPLLVTTIAWWCLPGWGVPEQYRTAAAGAILVVLFALLNSRMGRDTEELFREGAGRLWHRLRVTVIFGLFNLIVDLSRQVLDAVERVLYSVDESLRFRSGESRGALWFKAVFGLFWNIVHAVVRFCVTLLIEPQVNPIKHFPIVTVSHKLLLPMLPLLTSVFDSFMNLYYARLLAGAIIFTIPGVFGFLAWELKENWRLYLANRSKELKPVMVGHHGETVLRLLLPGFHSGTIPKLFARRRRAARKMRHLPETSRQSLYDERLHHEAEALRHLFDREFVALLRASRTFRHAPISVKELRVSTNRIEALITHDDFPELPATIALAEQSGWLVATVANPGWISEQPLDARHVVTMALGGLYQLCGVALVREQIERHLGKPPQPYDIGEAGLVVWPTRSFETEIHFNLNERPLLIPRPRSAARNAGLEPVAAEALIYREQGISWTDWQAYWEEEARGTPSTTPIAAVPLLP